MFLTLYTQKRKTKINEKTLLFFPKRLDKVFTGCIMSIGNKETGGKEMKYEEIKERTKKAIESQDTILKDKVENLYDEIDDILYNAEEFGKGELVEYIIDIKIYDEIEKGISIHSEPRLVRKVIGNLLSEMSRPASKREHIEYIITEENYNEKGEKK